MKGGNASVVNVSVWGWNIRHFERCLRRLNLKRFSFAFTLAEVLITLGIIGIVAAMTIPTLVANYQAKSWNTSASVFEKKFTEAIKTMNVQGKLGSNGGYSTTEGFVAELQNHFKILKVCDNNSLMECFGNSISLNDKTVDMTQVKTAIDMGQKTWGTNVIGFQAGNGVTALIAYNPSCTSNPYNNMIDGSDCYALVYDTSGNSSPNEINKDVRRNANAIGIDPSTCGIKINGQCYTPPTPVASLSWNACGTNGTSTNADDQKLMSELGIKYCMSPNYGNLDRWAGAVKTCGGVDKMVSSEDIAKLANELYDTQIYSGGCADNSGPCLREGLTLNTQKALAYGFNDTYFRIPVSDQMNESNTSYYRQRFYYSQSFRPNVTDFDSAWRDSADDVEYVVCKSN